NGKARIISDVRADPDFLNRTGRLSGIPADIQISFLCIPIQIGGQPEGALAVDKPYSSDAQLAYDHAFLNIVGAYLAQAIQIHRMVMRQKEELIEENAQLRAQVRDRFRFENIIGD